MIMAKVTIEVFTKANGKLGYDINVEDDFISGNPTLEDVYAEGVGHAVNLLLEELHGDLEKSARRAYKKHTQGAKK